MTLQRGQYSLPLSWYNSELVFGANTPFPVETIDFGGHDSVMGDYHLTRSDEIRFGRDFFKPGNITFTMGILENKALPNIASYGDVLEGILPSSYLRSLLMTAWRADEARAQWDYAVPLSINKDGRVKTIYGRPRKIAISGMSRKSEFSTVVADFQRADTLVYLPRVNAPILKPNERFRVVSVYPGEEAGIGPNDAVAGTGPTKMFCYLSGPMKNPSIVFPGGGITLTTTIPAGESIVISNSPEGKMIVGSTGQNLSATLTSGSNYLDQFFIQPMIPIPGQLRASEIHLMATGTTAASGWSCMLYPTDVSL